MKPCPVSLLILIIAIAFTASLGAQSVPSQINYQGQLRNADGTFPQGSHKVEINLYDQAIVGSTNEKQLWGPQKFDGSPGTPAEVVVDANGYFNIQVGPKDTGGRDLATVLHSLSNDDVYIEIKLDVNKAISPRQKILSTPFALSAAQVAGLNVVAGSLGIGTSPKTKLHVKENGEGVRIEAIGASAYLSFADSNGIQTGYVGDGSSENNDMYLVSLSGSVHLLTPGHYALTANSAGNVGIGTSTPQAKLDLFSGFDEEVLRFGRSTGNYHAIQTSFHGEIPRGNYLGFNVERTTGDIRRVLTLLGDGFVGVGTASPPELFSVAGNICYTGDIFKCSDGRFKENVHSITNALEIVTKLRAVRFIWRVREFPEHKFNDGPQVGFIAQEVKEVIPEAVKQGSDGVFRIDATLLIPVIVQAIKESRQSVNDRLWSQESEINSLRRQIQSMEDELATERKSAAHWEVRFTELQTSLSRLSDMLASTRITDLKGGQGQ